MKRIAVLLSIFLPICSAFGQTVRLDSVSKTNLCVGDSIKVYYTATGAFAGDNFFTVQQSDGTGSFFTFTNIGHSTKHSDSITVTMGGVADQWRFRAISTDPYIISDTSKEIRVASYPTPNPLSNLVDTYAVGPVGFIGTVVQFHDGSTEPPGSTSFWTFGEDANVTIFNKSTMAVSYATEGNKTGALTVSNGTGCSRTVSFKIRILSCDPHIPDTAYIVTGTESGRHPYVWVKTGGNYTAIGDNDNFTTVFVEPGASLTTAFRSEGLYYIKKGASVVEQNYQGNALFILHDGASIQMSDRDDADTLSCTVAASQSIHLGALQKDSICIGALQSIPYTPVGAFNSNNIFFLMLSDSTGSFTTSSRVAGDSLKAGSFKFVINKTGSHYRLRVISTNPSIISDTSAEISVFDNPHPMPASNLSQTYLGPTGFTGNAIQFSDTGKETAGTTYFWQFNQDANVVNSTPEVTYSTTGTKTGSVLVTNQQGCSISAQFQINLLSCNPQIPSSAHIVTTKETKHVVLPNVWIKAGGTFTQDTVETIFVEPGGTLNLGTYASGTIYLRTGAIFNPGTNRQWKALAILPQGMILTITSGTKLDTLYCSDLAFDTSQFKNDVEVEENPFEIESTPNNLRVTSIGEIHAEIYDLLGIRKLSALENDVLTLDLSSLPSGIYFASITSGKYREVRKILVVH